MFSIKSRFMALHDSRVQSENSKAHASICSEDDASPAIHQPRFKAENYDV